MHVMWRACAGSAVLSEPSQRRRLRSLGGRAARSVQGQGMLHVQLDSCPGSPGRVALANVEASVTC